VTAARLERDRLALALVLPDRRCYVAAGDLDALLGRFEIVALVDGEGERVGSAYQDCCGSVRFLVWGGSCYAARVELVRGLLTMATVPAVPAVEVAV
jgi:hypothetical protein